MSRFEGNKQAESGVLLGIDKEEIYAFINFVVQHLTIDAHFGLHIFKIFFAPPKIEGNCTRTVFVGSNRT